MYNFFKFKVGKRYTLEETSAVSIYELLGDGVEINF